MSNRTLLTVRELADAIGASESSLRRWVDGGQIRISRTAGGHRRIPVSEAIRFIRSMGATVVRPELLGLGELLNSAEPGPESPGQLLFEALKAGHSRMARGMLLSWYLQGQSLAEVFDGPTREALHRLGELWEHDRRGILVEHRATAICINAVAQLRSLLSAAPEGAPVALGGAPEGDPYLLPTMMAGAVLAEAGVRDVNFGANTPLDLLAREAIERRARLVWVSLSTQQEPRPLRRALRALAGALAEHGIELVLGGRLHQDYAPRGLTNVRLMESMSALATRARELLAPAGNTEPQ